MVKAPRFPLHATKVEWKAMLPLLTTETEQAASKRTGHISEHSVDGNVLR